MKKLFIYFTILSTIAVNASAQTLSAPYCPYTFTRDLNSGTRGADIKVLQQILNSDQRTVIAANGPASPGSETEIYGIATREAVKKFQALFIEYVGTANGVFGPKTRTVMNAVCNGDFYTKGTGTSYGSVSTQNTTNNSVNTGNTGTVDNTPPAIYLRSNSTSVNAGTAFRVIVSASKPIQTFTPESIIIEGGQVSDIRKLSPNSYSLLITPNEGAKSVIAQVEADRVLDLNGIKNDNASNEIRISVTVPVTTATPTAATPTSGVTSGELDSLFNKLIAQVTPAAATTCSNGSTNPPSCNNYQQQPNYNSGSNSGNNNRQQDNGLMNMLLLSSLMRGNNSGGGLFGGGGAQGNGGLCQLNPSHPSCTGGGGMIRPADTGIDPAKDINRASEAGGNKDEVKADGNQSTVPTGGKIKTIYNCPVMVNREGTVADIKQAGRKFYLVSNNGKDYTGLLSFKSNTYSPIAGNDYLKKIGEAQEDTLKCCQTYDANRKVCMKEVEGTQGKKAYWFKGEVDFSGTKATDINNGGNSNTPATKNPNSLIPDNLAQPQTPSNPPNQRDNQATNDPNSLTPSNPSQLTPQQCADYANSIKNPNGYVSNAITATVQKFPECGYSKIKQSFFGSTVVPNQ